MTRPAAITRTEALLQLSQEVEDWLETAMPVINEKLKNFVEGSYRRIYDNEIGLNELSADAQKRAIEEIISAYPTWTVKHVGATQTDSTEFFYFS